MALFRSKAVVIPIAIIISLCLFAFAPLPTRIDDGRDQLIQHITDSAKGGYTADPPKEPDHTAGFAPLHTTGGHKPDPEAKYAFATFLAGTTQDPSDTDWNHDHYFLATRILAYQLLHCPETRSKSNIPFVVLVTRDVPEAKRARLTKDGATVVEAEYLHEDWIVTETSTWQDVMTKLRLWELTQYERIAFLDGDTILTRPLDGLFDDPAVRLMDTGNETAHVRDDEDPLPPAYSFAGVPEMKRVHGYPPTDANHDYPNINYLNAGFFVFRPSADILAYYASVMKVPNRFNPMFPEQNLLNYAHRREGNMPWTMLGNEWNIHYPTVEDLLGGVASLHEKWWAPVHDELRPFMDSWRWRMEGFFEARDAAEKTRTTTPTSS
ncbi:hypothetical protein B0A49_00566 [Cryomyces minteri]|uniref:Nucleotide-diphospho-sugar transferase n=1 Tax=Cryomyces minteri TaxID=331657 RepID=A0A4U0XQD7_9PEZI|nr:hypothetical protein B0A49_00566 [Cryomyces minteri]